jgi:pimeloyl-ACP methyl ester carboxylesterase
VIEAIETRELITLDRSGIPLRGTYHKPIPWQTVPEPGPSSRGKLGIVFLNSLAFPRAATGDSAVFWADALAAAGYSSFRIDLPGLGDSEGAIPGDFLDYINSGGYAQTISLAVKELRTRFQLSGMLLFGHCAGAVSAIFAAAGKEFRGLVLMDPYFHLNQAVRSPVRQGLSNWARRSKLGSLLSDAYYRFRAILLHLRHNALPKNANRQLLERWKDVASSGLPILYLKAPSLKAPGTKPRVGEFDYLQHILDLAGPRSQVVVQLIECTDHSFANRLGRASVLAHIQKWLHSRFPLPQSNGTAASDTRIRAGSEEQALARQEHCQRRICV